MIVARTMYAAATTITAATNAARPRTRNAQATATAATTRSSTPTTATAASTIRGRTVAEHQRHRRPPPGRLVSPVETIYDVSTAELDGG